MRRRRLRRSSPSARFTLTAGPLSSSLLNVVLVEFSFFVDLVMLVYYLLLLLVDLGDWIALSGLTSV